MNFFKSLNIGCKLLIVNYYLLFGFLSAQNIKINNAIDSLEKLLSKSFEDTSRINQLNLLAGMYISIDPVKSYQHVGKALELSGKLKFNYGYINAYNTLATLYMDESKYPLALETFLKSLKLLEEENDKKRMASTLNNIGIIYQHLGNPEEALKNYFESLKIKEELGDMRSAAATYNNIGEVYRLQGKDNEALKFYHTGLKISEQLNDRQRMGEFYNNIGILYDLSGKFDEAMSNYLKSIKIDEEIGNRHGEAGGYVNIGYVFMGKGNYKQAFDYFEKGIAIGRELKYKDAILGAYEGYYESYMKKGDYKKALEYYRLHTEMNDSILNSETTLQIAEMQTKYETGKKEAQIELQKSDIEKKALENRKQKTILWLVAASLLIAVAGAVFIFRSLRVTKKQNRIIQKQKILVEQQKHLVEEKNMEITDSITYAKRLQRSFLPTVYDFDSCFKEYFVLYRPKDIVSGDFYWLASLNTTPENGITAKLAVLAVADCTGHGVPGAFMSMMGNTLLNQTIKNPDINSPAQALDHLNRELPKNIKKHDAKDIIRDGMDMVMCAFDMSSMKLFFAGANNLIYLVRNNTLMEFKGDKQPISASDDIPKKNFTNHTIELLRGDTIYLTTDGYPDQFGGPKGKKFKYSQFEKLLVSMQDKSMSEQREILNDVIEKWKGTLEQIDDICVIGLRI